MESISHPAGLHRRTNSIAPFQTHPCSCINNSVINALSTQNTPTSTLVYKRIEVIKTRGKFDETLNRGGKEKKKKKKKRTSPHRPSPVPFLPGSATQSSRLSDSQLCGQQHHNNTPPDRDSASHPVRRRAVACVSYSRSAPTPDTRGYYPHLKSTSSRFLAS